MKNQLIIWNRLVLMEIGLTFITIFVVSNFEFDKLEIVIALLFANIVRCFSLIKGLIKGFTLQTNQLQIIKQKKTVSYYYENIEDIKYYNCSYQFLGFINIYKCFFIVIQLNGEKYNYTLKDNEELYKVYQCFFDHMAEFYEKEKLYYNIPSVHLKLGNQLKIEEGMLKLGKSAQLPLTNAFIKKPQNGTIEIFCKDNNREKVWLYLNPMKYINTIQLEYIISKYGYNVSVK